MLSIALLIRDGDAAEQAGDFARAYRCFEEGAEFGDPVCWCRLGRLFDLGRGVAVDKDRAMACYRRAWLRRVPASARYIAELHRDRGDARTMARWLQRAARYGDGASDLALARCHLDGFGVRVCPETALRHLAAARDAVQISDADRTAAVSLIEQLQPLAVA